MSGDLFNSACAELLYSSVPTANAKYAELVKEGLIKDSKGFQAPAPKSRSQKFLDGAFSWYIHAMLSNVSTHVTNMVSNTVPLATRIGETTLSATSAFVETGDVKVFKEISADASGMVQGFIDGLRYLQQRATYAKHGQMRSDTLTKLKLPTKLMYRNKAQLEGQYTDANPMSGSTKGMAQAWQWAQVMLPGNQLANMDTFFKIISYRAEVSKLAMRKANKLGGGADEIGKNYAKIRDEAFLNPDGDTSMAGVRAAEEATYTDMPGNKMDRWMAEDGNKVPGLRWVVPFKRTMVNIIKWGTKRTILGALAPHTYKALAKGGQGRHDAIGRIGFGMMTITGTYAMVGDRIDSAAPSNVRARDLWERDGHKENHLRIGDGADAEFFDLDMLGGFGLYLKALAAVAPVLSSISMVGDDNPDQQIMDIAEETIMTTAEVFMQEHWMDNILGGMDAVSSALQEGNTKSLWIYAAKVAGAFNPNIIKQQVTKRIDPNVKDLSNPWESLVARVPVWSKTVANKIDLWGEPMRYDNFVDPAIASPITGADDLSVYMRKIGMRLPESRRTFQGVRMTPHEYEQFMIYAGKGALGLPPLRDMLVKEVTSPNWKKFTSDKTRTNRLRTVINKYRKAARIQLLNDPNFSFGQRVKIQQAKEQQQLQQG